jgi:PASTA domain-containing protein
MHIVFRHHLVCAAVVAGALLAGCGGGHGSDSAPLGAGPASAVFSSTSAPTVVVPRLVGRRQEEAHRLVDRAGLKLRWTGFTGKLGNGRYNVSCVKVLSQSPVAGERRPRGASIAVIETACHTPTMKPYSMFREEPKR